MPPLGHVRPRWWIPIVVGLVLVDYVSGREAPAPVVYVLPVALAAWYSGQTSALWLALMLPTSRLVLELWVWGVPAVAAQEVLLTTMIHVSTYTLLALLIFRLSEHERALARDLRVLEGLLPLCAHCKSIRNGKDEWEPLETYLQSRSGATFSHGVCPACSRRHYPELFPQTPF
jgi:hypothetical protein